MVNDPLEAGDTAMQNLLDALSTGLLRPAARTVARAAARPKLLAALVSILGACLLIAGVALIYPPAAFVIAGGGLLATGLVPDYEPGERPGRR